MNHWDNLVLIKGVREMKWLFFFPLVSFFYTISLSLATGGPHTPQSSCFYFIFDIAKDVIGKYVYQNFKSNKESLRSTNVSTLNLPSSCLKVHVASSLFHTSWFGRIYPSRSYLSSLSHAPFRPGNSCYHLLLKCLHFYGFFARPHNTNSHSLLSCAFNCLKNETKETFQKRILYSPS